MKRPHPNKGLEKSTQIMSIVLLNSEKEKSKSLFFPDPWLWSIGNVMGYDIGLSHHPLQEPGSSTHPRKIRQRTIELDTRCSKSLPCW